VIHAYRPRPPRALVAAKVLLAALLVIGALFPDVGGFAGKGMAFRLPVFLAPALVVPVLWHRRGGAYPVALDVALTVPFLLDTAANAFGLFDSVDVTDDVLHFVNWAVLVGGVTATWAARVPVPSLRWLLFMAGTGFGALAIIGWEAAEYGVMRPAWAACRSPTPTPWATLRSHLSAVRSAPRSFCVPAWLPNGS
jgi:hypothetical protein